MAGAVECLARSLGGSWIAWSGGDDGRRRRIATGPGPGYTLRTIGIPPAEAEDFYHGLANRLIWPLSHGFPERCRSSARHWRAYVDANRRFAAAVLEERRPGQGAVWVHDYQLGLVPGFVRQRAPEARIVLFWHIPFPSSDLMRANPWRHELLSGLVASDLVAFHRDHDVGNFLDCIEGLRSVRVDRHRSRVRLGARQVEVRAIPLGVDAARFDLLARSDAVRSAAAGIRRAAAVEHLALSVERLDYTKGIIERVRAIELLFLTYPQLKGRITFVQIAVPSRERISEYGRLRADVEAAVRRVNDRLGADAWRPIELRLRGLPQDDLVPYYLASDLMLVTPLKDGMNLVAKEYVASKPEEDGAVVLSRFAGVAEEFGDAAVVVNPHHPLEVVRGIRQALMTSPAERRARMRRLRTTVREHDVRWWVNRLIEEMRDSGSDAGPGLVRPDGGVG